MLGVYYNNKTNEIGVGIYFELCKAESGNPYDANKLQFFLEVGKKYVLLDDEKFLDDWEFLGKFEDSNE